MKWKHFTDKITHKDTFVNVPRPNMSNHKNSLNSGCGLARFWSHYVLGENKHLVQSAIARTGTEKKPMEILFEVKTTKENKQKKV